MPLDASVDFFAIAVPSTDRLYDAGGERDEERLLTWPLTTGANLGWQYTAVSEADRSVSVPLRRLRPRAHDGGVLPGAREHRHQRNWRRLGIPAGGYSMMLNGAWFARTGWREWGFADDSAPAEPFDARYAKYSGEPVA